jgi:hypothetical protein
MRNPCLSCPIHLSKQDKKKSHKTRYDYTQMTNRYTRKTNMKGATVSTQNLRDECMNCARRWEYLAAMEDPYVVPSMGGGVYSVNQAAARMAGGGISL